MRYRRNTEETNFWAGYADCMLALFMIALLLWILSSGTTVFTNQKYKEELDSKGTRLAQLEEEILNKDKLIAELENDIKELEAIVSGGKGMLEELRKLRSSNMKLQEINDDLVTKNKELLRDRELYLRQLADLKVKYDELNKKYRSLKDATGGKTIEALLAENIRLKKELNDKPPIINLTEGVTREFSFPSGEATVPPQFLKKLHIETFPKLREILTLYPKIDTLEIVGHTDGSPINSKGNTDFKIPELLINNVDGDALKPGSNVDLGLMRALSIRNAWYEWLKLQPIETLLQLDEIDLRCYSAAQTVPPGKVPQSKRGWLANDPKARRIEIRFTQLRTVPSP